MENALPNRKSSRLKGFDYSAEGAYFITICTRDRKRVLSEIVNSNSMSVDEVKGLSVGEGLAPPEYSVKLKPCGVVAKEQLKLLEARYPNVTVSDYVIMPDHIHAVIFFGESAGGASPSPTLNEVVCTFKSLTSRFCKKQYGVETLFQRSYADHIIRDKDDYETRRRYIYENPMRWKYKRDIIQGK